MDEDGYGLATAIAPLLRAEREKAALTQAQLARRAATTQQHVSMIESGHVAPTIALLDRLFDALGLQLRVSVEQRDADLDAGMDAASDDTREDDLCTANSLTKRLDADVPFLLDGQLAAAMMGVPIKVRRTDLAFAEADADKVAHWLAGLPNVRRWSDKWQDFAPIDRDPRKPGPPHYWTPWGELHVRLLPAAPPPVRVVVAERSYPIRPLSDVEADYPQIARIIRRARHRT
ncbi:helix-turn-helix transcriptional regulator [Asanoa sp. NPDC049573]|uniref:helix-turn-helix domain-containing protein n=1 Tax=Asanoa sp. NPDC049573 TaxID=3155396 RepID=UPI0034395495